jgi:linoleoyl-CoA desaturase
MRMSPLSQWDESVPMASHPAEKASPPAVQPPRQGDSDKRLKFIGSNGFQTAIRRRVDEYFRSTGRRQRDCLHMYLKTAVVFAWCVTSYLLLVCWAATWWQALPLAFSLGLAMAAIGFNVQHDGGHHAYSDRRWVNKLMALTLDLIGGGSSYVWHWKHNIIHHTYVNITGHDNDIDLGPLARLTPHQRHLSWHRFQHWYMWPLYGFVTIKWQFFDDFRDVLTGRIGSHRIPRPVGWDLVAFVAGKVSFFSLALGIPLLLHPPGVALLFYGVVSCVLGVVFQLAHCVEDAVFPRPEGETDRIDNAWAVHQVQTTVDFARTSRMVAWLLGGLNFQVEHHLFPRICHVHYPALSPLVEETCRQFGIRYAVHETFRAGLTSHYRWLRRMGRSNPA